MECLTLPRPTLPNQGVNLDSSLAGGDTELIEDAPAYYAVVCTFAGAKKDFGAIAIHMGKPASECIEFYYLNKPQRPLRLAEPSNSNLPKSDDPISNNRAASIDIDGSIWFRSSNGYSPPSIRWSKHDQETFRGIANKFPDVLPGLGFKIPVGSNVLLAFKRIAAQMPHMTTAQVLEFHYWEKNPTRFDDAHLIYDADLHSHRASVLVVGRRKRA
ncbi:hypothetical protein B0H14DRAFT_2713296 [Mycena olivaceomarginata]|nr:hypothetical protein B0H14DRAFT_2713296 [Mycena olivaceomarginata]